MVFPNYNVWKYTTLIEKYYVETPGRASHDNDNFTKKRLPNCTTVFIVELYVNLRRNNFGGTVNVVYDGSEDPYRDGGYNHLEMVNLYRPYGDRGKSYPMWGAAGWMEKKFKDIN
jgi:hypothetical protein